LLAVEGVELIEPAGELLPCNRPRDSCRRPDSAGEPITTGGGAAYPALGAQIYGCVRDHVRDVFWGIVAVLAIWLVVYLIRANEFDSTAIGGMFMLGLIAFGAFMGIGQLIYGETPINTDYATTNPTTTVHDSSGAGGSGGGTVSIEDVYGDDVVEAYCSGAMSVAQYRGCIDHVTFDDVVNTDTPAARDALDLIPPDASRAIDEYNTGYP
jgi:hypothetical protein